ncbi:hypothetical protein FHK92_02175 [Pseudomonas brassicacearum subsp. neoaurantiaca]|uniref:Uncharacterized protein n=1 Tax=Pseudomonas brassicacearum subsp. neoaurantiaca TaxID=494916 RepID=A0A7V8RHL0_9PSED|nr:hypothetical protein [Pseudomonas brassicacearum subsp. neoaurantiaca]
MHDHALAWRGSLLPLGCEAVVDLRALCLTLRPMGTASRSSGSKLPRHKGTFATVSGRTSA